MRSRSPKAKAVIGELARREIERRRAENPLKYFVPNGWSEKFIHAVGHKLEKWIFILPAANSITKSASTINILGNLIWGPQNLRWYNGPRFELPWTSPKKFWYISRRATLEEFICGSDSTTENEISKWFPQGRYTFSKSGREFNSRFISDTGWVGSFKTYDQETNQFESDKIGVAVFDEPPPEAVYNAVLARMTVGSPIVIMPMTPLTYSAWIKDRLIDGAGPNSPVEVFYGDIEENCQEHGVRGRLSHKRIEELIAQYDEDEREARAHGLFAHLSGLVYKSIHPEVNRHQIPAREFNQTISATEFADGKTNYKIFCVCDPHDSKPPIIGWFAVDRWGTIWAVDEFPSERHNTEFKPFYDYKPGQWRLTIEQTCEWIKKIEERNGWNGKLITRVMDPNFGRKPEQTVGRTIAQHYRDCGSKLKYPLHFTTDVLDDIDTGHQVVREFLAINPDNQTRLKIGHFCSNIWFSMTHYMRKVQSASSLEANGPTELVQVKFKDGADLVRYMSVYFRKPGKPRPEEKEIRTLDDMVERQLERNRKRAAAMARPRPQYEDSSYI